jgi:oligopeptide transport system substrate-binding protein
MSWLQDLRMAYALYEPLVRWDNADFDIEPAAATWRTSADGLTWTFSIRPDARWSNGDPLLAQDYVYAWRRAILPDTAADYSNAFFAIEGAEAFFRWRADALREFVARSPGLPAAERSEAAEVLWKEGEERFAETVGVHALDDRTLRVRLTRPQPYFPDLVAFGTFCPVHRPTVEGWVIDEAEAAVMREKGWPAVEPPPWPERRLVQLDPASGRLQQSHGWTKAGRLVSNGPYVLAGWRYRRGLTLARNPFYSGPAEPRSETISCLAYEDLNTAVLAFESGAIDWLSDDMLAQRRVYESRYASEIEAGLAAGGGIDEILGSLPPPASGERRDIHVFPTFGTDFYSFNCRPQLAGGRANPFADARVRRAFVMSVDRQLIVDQVTRLGEPLLTSLIPPGSIRGYESPEGLGYDPDRARVELAEAGWVDRDGDGTIENEAGEPFPMVDLLYSTNTSRYKNISLALRDMWQRQLGVRVELRGKETKFFKEDLRNGNFMVGRGGWYGDYGDPTTFLELSRTGDGNNDRGYSSDYVDGLLAQAETESDPQQRLEILAECERFLVQEEVPMLILCQFVQVYMYEPGRLSGLSQHPRLVQYLWQMEVQGR